MLKEHINDIRVRWSPRERRGDGYDPFKFLETPEQARKLIRHLGEELKKAKAEKNSELAKEVSAILAQVEHLSRRFFRWEQDINRSLEANDIKEIKKLPIRM